MKLPHLVVDQRLGIVDVTPGTDPDALEPPLHGGSLVDQELPISDRLSRELHHSSVCASC